MIWQKVIKLLHRLEVNPAVFLSILTQGWPTLAGPVTMLVIAHWLTADDQGSCMYDSIR